MLAEKNGVRYIVDVKDWNVWNFGREIEVRKLEALTDQITRYSRWARELTASTGQTHKVSLHFQNFPRQGDTSNLIQTLRELLERNRDVLEITGLVLP